MKNRRQLIKNITLAGVSIPFVNVNGFNTLNQDYLHSLKQKLTNESSDEKFWKLVRKEYTLSKDYINMNNAGCSPQSIPVQKAFNEYNKLSNEIPSYYMSGFLDKKRLELKRKIAIFSGCSAEEIVINRNTTEALETIIFGLDLNKGDEVVLSEYDYPHMIFAWEQRAKRDGIVLRYVDFNFPEENENKIIKKYKELFNEKTKLVQITHMINYTGQILPVKKIADVANQNNIEVLVDAAHTFSHLDMNISDLNCDYYATSFHKWLCAPFGTGMLYVNKDKIDKIWPLLASKDPNSDLIEKFESLGTRSLSAECAVGVALDFSNFITIKRKEKRLRFLKDYWLKKVSKIDNVKVYTSFNPIFSCGLATIGFDNKDPNQLEYFLLEKYKIHVTTIEYKNIRGIRISPNIYTSLDDLDYLVKGIKEFVL